MTQVSTQPSTRPAASEVAPAVVSKPRGRGVASVRRAAAYLLLVVLSIAVLVPFAWMVSSSLKLDNEVFSIPVRWIPAEFHWDNFSKIWERIPLLTYLRNSVFLSLSITALQVLTGSFAAYGFAKVGFT